LEEQDFKDLLLEQALEVHKDLLDLLDRLDRLDKLDKLDIQDLLD
jgi:hypothetical protein